MSETEFLNSCVAMAKIKECEKTNGASRFQAQFEKGDPFASIISILEKKGRNLEKRKSKVEQLKDSMISGKALNDDQRASAMSLKEIETSIEFIKELISCLDVARSSHEKTSVNDAVPSCERSQNKDPVRRMLDLENDFKKLSENADKLKALKASGEDVLKPSEIETLLDFFSHNKISEKSSSNTYIRKVSSAYQKVFDRDMHFIYNGSSVTFEDIFVLSSKMASSFRMLKQVKPEAQGVFTEDKKVVAEVHLVEASPVKDLKKQESDDEWIQVKKRAPRKKVTENPQIKTQPEKPVANVRPLGNSSTSGNRRNTSNVKVPNGNQGQRAKSEVRNISRSPAPRSGPQVPHTFRAPSNIVITDLPIRSKQSYDKGDDRNRDPTDDVNYDSDDL